MGSSVGTYSWDDKVAVVGGSLGRVLVGIEEQNAVRDRGFLLICIRIIVPYQYDGDDSFIPGSASSHSFLWR